MERYEDYLKGYWSYIDFEIPPLPNRDEIIKELKGYFINADGPENIYNRIDYEKLIVIETLFSNDEEIQKLISLLKQYIIRIWGYKENLINKLFTNNQVYANRLDSITKNQSILRDNRSILLFDEEQLGHAPPNRPWQTKKEVYDESLLNQS